MVKLLAKERDNVPNVDYANEIVRDRFNYLLNAFHLSQIELVEKCKPYFFSVGEKEYKITKSDINQYVKGKAVPRSFKATIIGNALDVSPAWLMGFDVPMNGSIKEKRTLDISSFSEARETLIRLCMEAPEEEVAMLYRLVAAARNVKV